jgi:hypothetical protein
MKTTIKKWCSIFLAASILAGIASCTPEDTDLGNGLSDSNVDASFTITPDPSSPNKFNLQGKTTGIITSKWIIDGVPNYGEIGVVKNIFLPDAGTYTITHSAIGRGGVANNSSQELVVETSDPVAGNLVIDGRFPEGQGTWTVLNINGTETTWAFAPGSATITGGSGAQQGIYQAVQVEANRQYKLDMVVQGSGATDTWFEVFASPIEPVQNQDYSAGGTRIGLNTWGGCGNNAFNGKLSEIGCSGTGSTISFPTSGLIYIVIKSGGSSLGTTGIKVSNVELRGIAQ